MKNYFFIFIFLPAAVIAQTGTKNIITDKIPGSTCDNIVYNKLPPDAPNRSPSACEAQFHRKVRTALRDAFSKALQNFPAADWVLSDTAIEDLDQVSKQTEKVFFNLSYYFRIDLNPISPVYKGWSEKFQAIMEELKNPDEASFKKFADFNYKMNNAVHIRFCVRVNSISDEIYFIKGGQQAMSIPGAAYAVNGPYAAALSGGGEENALDACLIIFGKPKLTIQKDNGGMSARAETVFPKNQSKLTVQEISIRIECNDELLNKALKVIDFKSIAALTGH